MSTVSVQVCSIEAFLISLKSERKWIRDYCKSLPTHLFNQTTLLLSLRKAPQDVKILWPLSYTKPLSNECKCKLFVNPQLHVSLFGSINEGVCLKWPYNALKEQQSQMAPSHTPKDWVPLSEFHVYYGNVNVW